MNVLLLGHLVADYKDLLEKKLSRPHEIRAVRDPHGPEAADALRSAEVVILNEWKRSMLPAPKLRLLQVGGAGTDAIDRVAIPDGVPLCNAFGHEAAIGEYAVLALLAWFHRMLDQDRSFRSGNWGLSPWVKGPVHDELAGKTVGILGMGRIGLEAARRIDAMGARVIACNRSPRPRPEFVAEVYAWEQTPEFLSACDALVVSCALTPETTGLLDERRLALLSPHAIVVNIARGPVIDEDALYAALKGRRIAGAVLDVWYRYPTRDEPSPRPSRKPFHELQNVIMTPHASAWTRGMLERRVSQIAENIERLEDGRPLINHVSVP
jgi:phosphoglycerate dehydrogenase-like enzyme